MAKIIARRSTVELILHSLQVYLQRCALELKQINYKTEAGKPFIKVILCKMPQPLLNILPFSRDHSFIAFLSAGYYASTTWLQQNHMTLQSGHETLKACNHVTSIAYC